MLEEKREETCEHTLWGRSGRAWKHLNMEDGRQDDSEVSHLRDLEDTGDNEKVREGHEVEWWDLPKMYYDLNFKHCLLECLGSSHFVKHTRVKTVENRKEKRYKNNKRRRKRVWPRKENWPAEWNPRSELRGERHDTAKRQVTCSNSPAQAHTGGGPLPFWGFFKIHTSLSCLWGSKSCPGKLLNLL